MQALATPIGVALAVAVLVAWGRYAPKPAIAFEDWFKVAVVLALLLAQVPASATVRNQGYRTYWRHATPGET